MVRETKPAGSLHFADQATPQRQKHSLPENPTLVERLHRWILKVSGSSLHETFWGCPGGVFGQRRPRGLVGHSPQNPQSRSLFPTGLCKRPVLPRRGSTLTNGHLCCGQFCRSQLVIQWLIPCALVDCRQLRNRLLPIRNHPAQFCRHLQMIPPGTH
jgi:hypothetical protein